MAPVKYVWAPNGLSCCPFSGDGSVVDDSLFYKPPIVCGGLCFGLCFGMHYFVSFLVLQSS